MKKLNLDIQRFSSTNKTTHYELPQFIGTDKPTWLGDFNSAMSTIDGAIYDNASDIDTLETDVASASATASQASQDVSTLSSTVSSLSSAVSAVTTTANNAQQTATSALNTANTANGKADTNASNITTLSGKIDMVEDNVEKFNLDTFRTIAKTDCSTSNVDSTFAVSGLVLATNSDSSIFKLYGQVFASLTNGGTAGYVSFSSSLRPESDITINGAGVVVFESAGGDFKACRLASLEVKTTGEIRIIVPPYGANPENKRVLLMANLYFAKDFTDTPIGD